MVVEVEYVVAVVVDSVLDWKDVVVVESWKVVDVEPGNDFVCYQKSSEFKK